MIISHKFKIAIPNSNEVLADSHVKPIKNIFYNGKKIVVKL